MPRKINYGYQAVIRLTSEYQTKFGKSDLTKFFSFSKFPDAFDQAKRQEMEWLRKGYGREKNPIKTKPMSNSTTKIPGISITSSWDRRREKKYFYVNASWVDRSKKKRKRAKGTKFSISKHGLRAALFLALKARLSGLYGKQEINILIKNANREKGEFQFIKDLQKVLDKRMAQDYLKGA